MVILDDLKQELESFRPKLKELFEVLAIDEKKEEIKSLQEQAAQPGFWDDTDNSHKVLKKTSSLQSVVNKYEKLS